MNVKQTNHRSVNQKQLQNSTNTTYSPRQTKFKHVNMNVM